MGFEPMIRVLYSWVGHQKSPLANRRPAIRMFLRRVNLGKPREIQRKRPAGRNRQWGIDY